MPRAPLKKLRTFTSMIDEIERADGVAHPATVLELCKLFRASESTVRAQREVIAGHVRRIRELERK
jgi:hypothetical protein